MKLKERLKRARKDKGLSQAQLAELLNVSQAAIQSLESGRVKSTTFLLELANKLDVTPEWLVGDEDTGNILHLNLPTGSIVKSLPFLKLDEIKQWIAHGILPTNVGTIHMSTDLTHINKKGFVIEVHGDAMVSAAEPSKSLFPGEYAAIDPERPINDGDVVLVEINQKDIKLRQYMRDGSESILIAFNPSYPLIPVNSDINFLGVVVSTQKYRVKLEI
jgi:SOS-response transcriptional repressor LexA